MPSLAVMAVAAGIALVPVAVGPDPAIGQPAPAFTLVDVQGKPHSLSDYKGKMVVIEWVNITCPLAQSNYALGTIPQLQKKYANKDVVWLSMIITGRQQDGTIVTPITPERAGAMAEDMVKKYGATPTAVLVDVGGAVAADYATKTSMHMFVVDRKGTLVYDGALDDTPEKRTAEEAAAARSYIGAVLDEALTGKRITTSKTKPYGCHDVSPTIIPTHPALLKARR